MIRLGGRTKDDGTNEVSSGNYFRTNNTMQQKIDNDQVFVTEMNINQAHQKWQYLNEQFIVRHSICDCGISSFLPRSITQK